VESGGVDGFRWGCAGLLVGLGVFGELVSEAVAHLVRADVGEVGEDLGAGAGGVGEEGEQEVFGAGGVVSEQGGFSQALGEGLFQGRGEGGTGTSAVGVRVGGNLVEGAVEVRAGDPPVGEGGSGGAAGGEDAGEEVFGAEVVVMVGAGRVGGEDDDVACLIAEFVEHR